MVNTLLQYGSQGDDVKELQGLLKNLGYDLRTTGVYDDNTVEMVKRYQESIGLAEDGIAGNKTLSALTNGKGLSSTVKTTATGFTPSSTAPTYNAPSYTAPTYTAPTYKESDTVKQAQAALNAQLAQKPGAYQSQWHNQLNDTIDKILNREKFSYDLNGDALYQQYKDKYIQQGKLAMGDAIGQASAMTGGYGNSYAQSVGQQAYQAQLQNLNDIVPELYQMALNKYNMEGQDLYNQASLIGAQEEKDYGRYRDTVADWLTERDYLAGRYDSERDYDYSKYVNDRDFDYGAYRDSVSDYQWNTSLDYQKYRDEMSDYQWNTSLEYQQYRDSIEDDQWKDEYDLAVSKVNTTGGKDTTGDDDDTPTGGSISASDIKKMQAAIGVDQDGKWGPKSKAAAGGLSVEEAYEAWKNGTLKKVGQNTELEMNWAENGGSYYSSVLNDLKGMKTSKKSNAEANAYLKELLDNHLISQSEYQTLYNKYRDNNLK